MRAKSRINNFLLPGHQKDLHIMLILYQTFEVPRFLFLFFGHTIA